MLVTARYVSVAVALLTASVVAASTFQGRWYFWHNPTWILSIDRYGIFLGPSGDPFSVDADGGLAVRMLVIGVPAWAAWRFRPRRSRSVAG